MVASRTPQPAIEIGSIVISMTGGTSWKTWPNSTGASIDYTTHQAMTTASTCTSNDSTATFGPCTRLNSTRLAITEQAWMWWVPHQRFSHGHGSRPSRRNPRPPARAAKSTNSNADLPCGDQAIAPGQARNDHHRERDQADGAV